jgi:hypothetical protein
VASLWLAGTAYAFWSFELKHERSFESGRTVLFDSATRERSAEAWFRSAIGPRGGVTVVHVYEPNCPCNRFTHPHLARIIANYQQRGVRFVAAARGGAGGAPPDGLQQVVVPSGSDLAWIEATPAALVFDANGRLVYFGPYSDSARCGDSGGLVERVLERMLAGQAPRPQAFYGGGCFCGVENRI